MTLEGHVQALLDLVEADRTAKCEAIECDAAARAAAALAIARTDARTRMRSAFADERKRRDARVAGAQARLQTHRRLHDQRRAAALLLAGWQRLPELLAARWREPQSRRGWVERVVGEARAALPRAAWRIVYAPGWAEDERNALAAALARDLGASPQLVLDASARAGLKVIAEGNVMDGTLPGLLADRSEIGAKLLQRLEQEE